MLLQAKTYLLFKNFKRILEDAQHNFIMKHVHTFAMNNYEKENMLIYFTRYGYRDTQATTKCCDIKTK